MCYKFLTSTAVDVMYCVFEGVVKKLGELWFDRKFSHESFNISNLVDIVDEKLSAVKPPSYFARRPRLIKTHFRFWKASELRICFFYTSVPILNNLLSDDYLDHYKLLLQAIYILCKREVTMEMINFAEQLIQEFLSRFEALYNVKCMTCNVYSLSNLPEIVRRLGPLWTSSCMPLEDINGKLKRLVHSSTKPELQIIFNLRMHVKVHTLKYEWLTPNSIVHDFCNELLSLRHKLGLNKKIGDSMYIVGLAKKNSKLDAQKIFTQYALQGNSIFLFKKLYKNIICKKICSPNLILHRTMIIRSLK